MLLSSPKEVNNKCNAFYNCNELERNMFQHGAITTAFNIFDFIYLYLEAVQFKKKIN